MRDRIFSEVSLLLEEFFGHHLHGIVIALFHDGLAGLNHIRVALLPFVLLLIVLPLLCYIQTHLFGSFRFVSLNILGIILHCIFVEGKTIKRFVLVQVFIEFEF